VVEQVVLHVFGLDESQDEGGRFPALRGFENADLFGVFRPQGHQGSFVDAVELFGEPEQ